MLTIARFFTFDFLLIIFSTATYYFLIYSILNDTQTIEIYAMFLVVYISTVFTIKDNFKIWHILPILNTYIDFYFACKAFVLSIYCYRNTVKEIKERGIEGELMCIRMKNKEPIFAEQCKNPILLYDYNSVIKNILIAICNKINKLNFSYSVYFGKHDYEYYLIYVDKSVEDVNDAAKNLF